MNELVAPIYHVFATAGEDWTVNAEADAFYCFTALLSDFRDLYIRSLDKSGVGVRKWILRGPAHLLIQLVGQQRRGTYDILHGFA